MRDAVRLAVGTLTVLPVRPPGRVDRRTARLAMLLAPVVGLALGLVAAGVLTLARFALGPPLDEIGRRGGDPHLQALDLLAAALALGTVALLTRGLHLDGLADTADGLGSGRTGAAARDVLRRPDIGPFGVVTLVVVLLIQVAGLAAAASGHHGTTAVVVAVATGRVALLWAARRGIPAARPDGLGAAVVGTVPVSAAAAWTVGLALLAAGLAWLDDDSTTRLLVAAPLAVLVGCAAAAGLLRRCVGRFGGATGDVLGAAVETATAAALVVLAGG